MSKLNFFFLLVSILHFGHGLTPGQECGTEPNIGLYMYKNGIFGCHKPTCDADQFWSVAKKRCLRCTGSLTNSLPNTLTSCKDKRPHENPAMPTLLSSIDTLASKDEQTSNLEENNSHHASGYPKGIENGTSDNVSMAQNDEETFGAENTSDEVIGFTKAVENVVVNPSLDKDIVNNISMKAPTPTPSTETEEVNTSVNSPNTDDKATIIALAVVFPLVVAVLVVVIVVQCVRGRKPSQTVPASRSRDDMEKGANDESQTFLLHIQKK